MTDEELVALARHGDADAFDQLVSRHQSAVYRAALAALRIPEDAEEAAQDAFVRGWRSLDRFRGGASFRTWILTIAWNRAITRRRRVVSWWRRWVPLDSDVENAVGVGSPLWGTASGSRDPYDTLRDSELKGHIVRAIEALSPKLRDTLLLASTECSYDEISAVLGIPIGTVKWRVAEARRKVRERLAHVGYADAR